MRIYRSCKEAASETKRELKELGTIVNLHTMQDKNVENNPDYQTMELIGYSFMITNTDDKEELPKSFNKESEINWAEAEFQERIGQQELNPGEAYKLRSVWSEFIHNDKLSYTYSERIGSQVEKIIEMLKNNPSSRNAIVSMWDRQIDIDNIGGKKRVPCTMYYQFLIRNNKLNLIYNIRSNDVITHWCWDVYLAVKLQEYVADRLGLEKGWFIEQCGSLHAYNKDLTGIF